VFVWLKTTETTETTSPKSKERRWRGDGQEREGGEQHCRWFGEGRTLKS
jgi:hypothetical protein